MCGILGIVNRSNEEEFNATILNKIKPIENVLDFSVLIFLFKSLIFLIIITQVTYNMEFHLY